MRTFSLFFISLFLILEAFSQDLMEVSSKKYLQALNSFNNQLFEESIRILQTIPWKEYGEKEFSLKIRSLLALEREVSFQEAKTFYLKTYKEDLLPKEEILPSFSTLLKYSLTHEKVDDFFSLVIYDPDFFQNSERIKFFILSMIHRNYSPPSIKEGMANLRKYVDKGILEKVLFDWFSQIQKEYNIAQLAIFEQFFFNHYFSDNKENDEKILQKIASFDIILHSPKLVEAILVTQKNLIPLKYLNHPYISRHIIEKIFLSYLREEKNLDLYQYYVQYEHLYYPIFLQAWVKECALTPLSTTEEKIWKHIVKSSFLGNMGNKGITKDFLRDLQKLNFQILAREKFNYLWIFLDQLFIQDGHNYYKDALMDLVALQAKSIPKEEWVSRYLVYIQEKYPLKTFTQLSILKREEQENLEKKWGELYEKLHQFISQLPGKSISTWRAKKILWSYLDAITHPWLHLAHGPQAQDLSSESIRLLETLSIEKEKLWANLSLGKE